MGAPRFRAFLDAKNPVALALAKRLRVPTGAGWVGVQTRADLESLAALAATESPAFTFEIVPVPTWTSRNEVSPIDGTRIAEASIQSNRVSGGSSASLWFGCVNGSLSTRMNWITALAPAFPSGSAAVAKIAMRIDDEAPTYRGWFASNSWSQVQELTATQAAALSIGQLFVSETIEVTWTPAELARSLAGYTRLVAQATAAGGSTLVAYFDITGAAEALRGVLSGCGPAGVGRTVSPAASAPPDDPQSLRTLSSACLEHRLASGYSMDGYQRWCDCLDRQYSNVLTPAERQRFIADYAQFDALIGANPAQKGPSFSWRLYTPANACRR